MTDQRAGINTGTDTNYNALFDALPGYSCLIEIQGTDFVIAAVTGSYCARAGSTKAELIGRSLSALPGSTCYGSKENAFTELLASLDKVKHSKEQQDFVASSYPADGSNGSHAVQSWKVTNSPVFDATNELAYIISTAEEISSQISDSKQDLDLYQLKKVHEHFMQVPALIVMFCGEENIIKLANQATLTLVDNETNVIGQPLSALCPEIMEQGVAEILAEVRKTGKTIVEKEFPVLSKVGGIVEQHYFDVAYQPYYDGDLTQAAGVFTFAHDVTELVVARRKVEKAKIEAERQQRLYETITSNTPDLIYVFGLDYRFTYANKALLNMWGLSAEQAIGKSLLENGYEPWHAEMHEREIDHIIATKESVRGEVSFPHATLGRRVYDYILVPVTNDKGEVEAVAGTTRDITESKLNEQTARESEDRFRRLADDSPMFVFIIDEGPDARVSYWNKAWIEFTGQSAEQAMGTNWDGLIHPEDVSLVMNYYSPAFENKQPYVIPAVRVKRHDGEFRWHAFKGNPRYAANGDFVGYVGVGFDIHEQKLSEESTKQSEAQLQIKVAERTAELQAQKNLFDNILRNSSNGISVTEMIRDDNGKVIDAATILANDAAVRYIGLPREIYLTKTAVELDPDILDSAYGKTCLNTLETGEPSMSQYFMELTGRWQELTISKMDNDHLIHIFTDVTAIKEAQLQLEQTIEELKRSNANLEEFAFAASHDLKEPIRKIRTFSDRLKNKMANRLLDEDLLYFQRMEKATQRMQLLIDDLLDYSHVSTGNNPPESIDLNVKVQRVLEDLELTISDKNAKVIVGPLPVILGHRRQLQQLLQNLLTNALKFNKPGVSPEIRISSRLVGADEISSYRLPDESRYPQYNLLEIADNGIGFQQEYAEKIFKMFQRLHGNSEYEGTGIGLAIVRKVVENHRGFIVAESSPGEGATFKVFLPVQV